MKAKIIIFYLVAAFIYGFFSWSFGNYGYKNFAYNLGRGLLWPVNIFEDSTKIDASSDISFATSYQKIQAEHKNHEGVYLFNEAVSKIMMNTYVKVNKNFTLADYEAVENGSMAGYASANDMLASLFSNNRLLVREFREYVDGMSLIDVINNGKEAHRNTREILTQRQTQLRVVNTCVDSKVSAYRSEVGEEALVRYDMLEEWEDECSI